MTGPITVLGAGLGGGCVALALAERGRRVLLIDRRDAPMRAASLRNEGKIHLGLIFALDPTGETRRTMLEGALSFSPLVDRWCGPQPWDRWRSETFRLAVMQDSLLGVDELAASYEQLRGLARVVADSAEVRPAYLGEPLDWFWRHAADRRGCPAAARHVFEVEERSIDPRCLAPVIEQALRSHPGIELWVGQRVIEAERRATGFRLVLESPEGRRTHEAGAVINCTWEDRTRLDETLGIPVPAGLCYRVKHQALVRPANGSRSLVPLTMVQGPYGDIVPRPDGLVYLSWYPACRTYFSPLPPVGWEDREQAADVAARTVEAIGGLVPELRGAQVVRCGAGVIVARGETDIHDRRSGLHARSGFGATSHDGWWSVHPGKLTTAPLVAEQVASAVDAGLPR